MSVNKVNKTTGELVTLANGTRMWIGTQSAHDLAVQQGTMPNNCMVCITDDYQTENTDWVEGTNCRARKKNGIVFVQITRSTSVTLTTIATKIAELPEGFSWGTASQPAIEFMIVDNSIDCAVHARLRGKDISAWKNRQAFPSSDETTNSLLGFVSFPMD